MRHIPVLASTILSYIPPTAKLVVDGTLGHGGHTQMIIKHMITKTDDIQKNNGTKDFLGLFHVIGVDIDSKMLQKAKEYLSDYEKYITYIQGSYARLSEILEEIGKKEKKEKDEKLFADFILLDLGINWDHVLVGDRGFSIKKNGPLDMRYTKQGPTAYEILQRISPYEFMQKLIEYGDFGPKRAEQIAFLISKEKRNILLKTTGGLKKILTNLYIKDKELAVVFQVLRIITNDEFGHLRLFLENVANCLSSGGRCAIISYHSGEDRVVKQGFKRLANMGYGNIVTPKPLTPSFIEKKSNPASRSAKLRIREKK